MNLKQKRKTTGKERPPAAQAASSLSLPYGAAEDTKASRGLMEYSPDGLVFFLSIIGTPRLLDGLEADSA
jgi:hypothetical protein